MQNSPLCNDIFKCLIVLNVHKNILNISCVLNVNNCKQITYTFLNFHSIAHHHHFKIANHLVFMNISLIAFLFYNQIYLKKSCRTAWCYWQFTNHNDLLPKLRYVQRNWRLKSVSQKLNNLASKINWLNYHWISGVTN